jgi:excisionase family DNA binding protein
LAAIERLEAKLESLFPKLQAEVPKRRAYPLREAAILMGISLTKLKDLIRDRKISIVVAGARRRVLDAELNRYLLSRKTS